MRGMILLYKDMVVVRSPSSVNGRIVAWTREVKAGRSGLPRRGTGRGQRKKGERKTLNVCGWSDAKAKRSFSSKESHTWYKGMQIMQKGIRGEHAQCRPKAK